MAISTRRGVAVAGATVAGVAVVGVGVGVISGTSASADVQFATLGVATLTLVVATLTLVVAAVAFRDAGGRPKLSFRDVVSNLHHRPARRRAGVLGAGPGRAMRVAARLMPQAVGERWLGEAESFLFEALAEQRAAAVRNYLITAPQMIVAGWAVELGRRTRRRDEAAGTPQKVPRG